MDNPIAFCYLCCIQQKAGSGTEELAGVAVPAATIETEFADEETEVCRERKVVLGVKRKLIAGA